MSDTQLKEDPDKILQEDPDKGTEPIVMEIGQVTPEEKTFSIKKPFNKARLSDAKDALVETLNRFSGTVTLDLRSIINRVYMTIQYERNVCIVNEQSREIIYGTLQNVWKVFEGKIQECNRQLENNSEEMKNYIDCLLKIPSDEVNIENVQKFVKTYSSILQKFGEKLESESNNIDETLPFIVIKIIQFTVGIIKKYIDEVKDKHFDVFMETISEWYTFNQDPASI